MRDRKLGRWVARLACAVGVGAVVFLGASPANASPVLKSRADAANAHASTVVYQTADVVWG